MSELTDYPSEQALSVNLQLVYAPELIVACQADLERLLPEWLSLEPEDQQWRIQRFVEKLTSQPQLLPTFRAVLQQHIQNNHDHKETQLGIELLKDLKLMLDLAV